MTRKTTSYKDLSQVTILCYETNLLKGRLGPAAVLSFVGTLFCFAMHHGGICSGYIPLVASIVTLTIWTVFIVQPFMILTSNAMTLDRIDECLLHYEALDPAAFARLKREVAGSGRLTGRSLDRFLKAEDRAVALRDQARQQAVEHAASHRQWAFAHDGSPESPSLKSQVS